MNTHLKTTLLGIFLMNILLVQEASCDGIFGIDKTSTFSQSEFASCQSHVINNLKKPANVAYGICLKAQEKLPSAFAANQHKTRKAAIDSVIAAANSEHVHP